MMRSSAILFVAALTGAIITGCASTEIYDDPENQPDDIRNAYHYSSAEMRKAAQKALTKLLDDDDFNEFIEEYKRTHNGKRPFLKIAPVRNETNDPDLTAAVSELNSFLENQMRLSKKVRISRYEGVSRIAAIGASRDNEDDDNFKQETVAKRGTVEAAVLVMRPHLTSNTVSNGSRRRITRTFIIDVARIDNGEGIFTCTEQLGFAQKRGVVGW